MFSLFPDFDEIVFCEAEFQILNLEALNVEVSLIEELLQSSLVLAVGALEELFDSVMNLLLVFFEEAHGDCFRGFKVLVLEVGGDGCEVLVGDVDVA